MNAKEAYEQTMFARRPLIEGNMSDIRKAIEEAIKEGGIGVTMDRIYYENEKILREEGYNISTSTNYISFSQ